ncbi:hypothetical protein BJX61DRAFT_144968 [Aspergillus egyptiacus]|nr:hypothetical protein BJX61DRAFT_144968 [Aspergillus egyptiacus]
MTSTGTASVGVCNLQTSSKHQAYFFIFFAVDFCVAVIEHSQPPNLTSQLGDVVSSPIPYSHPSAPMKHLNLEHNDNVPYYIFALLFTILFLSFLGTYTDARGRERSTEE